MCLAVNTLSMCMTPYHPLNRSFPTARKFFIPQMNVPGKLGNSFLCSTQGLVKILDLSNKADDLDMIDLSRNLDAPICISSVSQISRVRKIRLRFLKVKRRQLKT